MGSLKGLGYFMGLFIGIIGMAFSNPSGFTVEYREIGFGLAFSGLMIAIISTPLLLYLKYKKNIISFKTMQRVLVGFFAFSSLASVPFWGWVSALLTTVIVFFLVNNQLVWIENEVQKQNNRKVHTEKN